jgi:hypothetical protein
VNDEIVSSPFSKGEEIRPFPFSIPIPQEGEMGTVPFSAFSSATAAVIGYEFD